MTNATARRVGGRPRRRKYKTNERVPLSLRVRPNIKALIDSASERAGLSQSAEAERRLDQSEHTEGLLPEILLLRHRVMGARLMLAQSTALEVICQISCHFIMQEGGVWSPDNWLADPRCSAEVKTAYARVHARIVDSARPPPTLGPTPTSFKGLGEWAADWALVDWQMALFEQRLTPRKDRSLNK
jgi:hypothetical protein